jgi:hypothetical protein
MARFTPWFDGAPLEPGGAALLFDEVLRPSLKRAFPLPSDADLANLRFQQVLMAMAQRQHHVAGP